jgi:hypothetical protein
MSNNCDDLRLLFHNKPTIANLLHYEKCEKDKQPAIHNTSTRRKNSRPRGKHEKGF